MSTRPIHEIDEEDACWFCHMFFSAFPSHNRLFLWAFKWRFFNNFPSHKIHLGPLNSWISMIPSSGGAQSSPAGWSSTLSHSHGGGGKWCFYMYFPGTVNPGLLNHQFIDRGLAILRVIYSITILGATQLSQLIVEGYYVRDWYIPIYLSGELKFWIWMACVAHVLLQGLEKNLRQFINRYWSEEADVEQREVYPGNDDRKLDTSTTGQAVLDTALQRVRHCRSIAKWPPPPIEPSPANVALGVRRVWLKLGVAIDPQNGPIWAIQVSQKQLKHAKPSNFLDFYYVFSYHSSSLIMNCPFQTWSSPHPATHRAGSLTPRA